MSENRNQSRDRRILPSLMMAVGVAFLIGTGYVLPVCGEGGEPVTDEAQHIYQDLQDSVLQIYVIDQASGRKSSAGSGFQFTPDGLIASNYHVIAQTIHQPGRYRVECKRHDGTSGILNVMDVDVIHDLSILKSTDAEAPDYMKLGESPESKGARIFAMGNLHDLGTTIVEGVYNGLMERTLYEKILFSGSINPGMSGGPAVGHDGRVMGINVATAGNQVSFLVPVKYLAKLQQRVQERGSPVDDWAAHIEQQLVANQDTYIKELLAQPWDHKPLGDASVPGEIATVFKCWGESRHKEEERFEATYTHCSSEDSLFISSDLQTGSIVYKAVWLTEKTLNPMQFYSLLEDYFAPGYQFNNAASKEDVTNFSCHSSFVNIDGVDFKSALCVRRYKKYQQLYDINLNLASVHRSDRGLLVELIALGLTQERAEDLLARFMKETQWDE